MHKFEKHLVESELTSIIDWLSININPDQYFVCWRTISGFKKVSIGYYNIVCAHDSFYFWIVWI